MPRRRAGVAERSRRANDSLVNRLAEELKSDRASGQPIIYEHEFPTGGLHVTVVWDEWDQLPLDERTEIVLRAYEQAEGSDYRGRIALASGLSVPEAYAAGMLPFQIIPAWRKSDPITLEQCRQAVIDEGASTLLAPDRPQLRFATLREAEEAKVRLIRRLPGSEDVWLISQDLGKVEDWAQR